MFRHRQQLRRWAARVLLLWLFGLGAGVANACLGTGQTAPVVVVAAHLADASGPHHAAADDGQPGSPVKTNCQDFCAKARVSIPPLKSALDDVAWHAVPATAAVTALPPPAATPVQSWVPHRDSAQPPPIPIAFLRLAL